MSLIGNSPPPAQFTGLSRSAERLEARSADESLRSSAGERPRVPLRLGLAAILILAGAGGAAALAWNLYPGQDARHGSERIAAGAGLTFEEDRERPPSADAPPPAEAAASVDFGGESAANGRVSARARPNAADGPELPAGTHDDNVQAAADYLETLAILMDPGTVVSPFVGPLVSRKPTAEPSAERWVTAGAGPVEQALLGAAQGEMTEPGPTDHSLSAGAEPVLWSLAILEGFGPQHLVHRNKGIPSALEDEAAETVPPDAGRNGAAKAKLQAAPVARRGGKAKADLPVTARQDRAGKGSQMSSAQGYVEEHSMRAMPAELLQRPVAASTPKPALPASLLPTLPGRGP